MSQQYQGRNNKATYIDSSKLCPGLSVEVRGTDDKAFDRAFRIFNKKCQTEGLVKEVRARQYYVKPAEKKRLAQKAARQRHLKELRDSDPRRTRLY